MGRFSAPQISHFCQKLEYVLFAASFESKFYIQSFSLCILLSVNSVRHSITYVLCSIANLYSGHCILKNIAFENF